MIVFVKEPGVFGVVLKFWQIGADVKWYMDGIEFKEFLLREEYTIYKNGGLDDDD